MRRLLPLGILLLAGCQSVVGPAKRGFSTDTVDQPRYNTGEQLRRARDQLAFPDGSTTAGPRTGAEIPNATGR
jgi:hypothetical protein